MFVQDTILLENDTATTDVKQTTLCTISIEEEKQLAHTDTLSNITMSDRGMTNTVNVNIHMIVGNGNEVFCTKGGNNHL